jgi:Eukaryotic translation initiation factor 3 subunit 8 N-terminus
LFREATIFKEKASKRATPLTVCLRSLQEVNVQSVNMSRFFRPAGDDSSSESSSDEEELYSEEEDEEKAASEQDSDEEEEDSDEESSEDEDGVKKKGANRFMRDAGSVSDESSDDDRAKVVKSAKDKRLEELEGTVRAIENGEKINDWGSISAGMLGRGIFLGLELRLTFHLQNSTS